MSACKPAIVMVLLLGLCGCATTEFMREQYREQRVEPVRGDVVLVTLTDGRQLRTTFEARDGDSLHTSYGTFPLDEVDSVTIDRNTLRSGIERVARAAVAATIWVMLLVLNMGLYTL